VKYDNRFEFTNPGLLKLPVERIYAGGESKARNQRMQALLRMIGFGEGLGSGFPLILNAWEEKHWVRPELIEEQDLMQVKLVLYIERNKDNVTKDVTKDVTKELSERQHEIMKMLIEEPTLKTEELAERFSVTRRTIIRDLDALQKKGILRREGGRTFGHWIIIHG